jgi:epoxide hydrolase
MSGTTRNPRLSGRGGSQWNELGKGGHFAAFEQPELFVDDVRKFFRTIR